MAGLALANRKLQLYGWDSRGHIWHGPNEIASNSVGLQRLTDSLLSAPGPSWYGPISCSAPGERSERFFVLAHKLHDCGVALIYCDESKTGPAEIVAVIPAGRRHHTRADFAFELLAFCNFLSPAREDADLAIHEGIAAALAEASPADSLVFSIGSDLLASDDDHALSLCIERVAAGLLRWLE